MGLRGAGGGGRERACARAPVYLHTNMPICKSPSILYGACACVYVNVTPLTIEKLIESAMVQPICPQRRWELRSGVLLSYNLIGTCPETSWPSFTFLCKKSHRVQCNNNLLPPCQPHPIILHCFCIFVTPIVARGLNNGKGITVLNCFSCTQPCVTFPPPPGRACQVYCIAVYQITPSV